MKLYKLIREIILFKLKKKFYYALKKTLQLNLSKKCKMILQNLAGLILTLRESAGACKSSYWTTGFRMSV